MEHPNNINPLVSLDRFMLSLKELVSVSCVYSSCLNSRWKMWSRELYPASTAVPVTALLGPQCPDDNLTLMTTYLDYCQILYVRMALEIILKSTAGIKNSGRSIRRSVPPIQNNIYFKVTSLVLQPGFQIQFDFYLLNATLITSCSQNWIYLLGLVIAKGPARVYIPCLSPPVILLSIILKKSDTRI